jgi:hypothetical protein
MRNKSAVQLVLALLTVSLTCLVAAVVPAGATGVASQLVVTTPPSGAAVSGEPLATQPIVAIEDSSGNIVTTATGTVTASIASGAGTISAGATATVTNGVATFSGLTITGATGTDTLSFFDGSLTTAVAWTGTTMSTSDYWYSITYGNGLYVAIAHGSSVDPSLPSGVAYSSDGSSWTSATLPDNNTWNSVTYGNGVFVAVAENTDEAAYSSDGSDWTLVTLPDTAPWVSVTYGNGLFVAVAKNTEEDAYSSDGSNWTLATMPSLTAWNAVTYGHGLFVAVADGTFVASSSNGINWTLTTMPSSDDWYALTYGNGLYVAVAYDSSGAAYSSDGINWVPATMPSSTNWYSIAYGNGTFVAISDNSSVASSTDGSNWTGATLPSVNDWSSVTYGNGQFVAVAFNSATAAVSSAITIDLSQPMSPPPPSGAPTPTLAQIRVAAASLTENVSAVWSPTVSVSGVQSGDSATVAGTIFTYTGTGSTTYAASTTAPTGPGTYSIVPSHSTVTITPAGDAANYDATIDYVPGTLVITPVLSTTTSNPRITATSTFARRLIFNAVVLGQTLQNATSVSIPGATARIISHGQLRLVVRIALAKTTRAGVRLALVRFAQGSTARFYVSVVHHGTAVVVRTSTKP